MKLPGLKTWHPEYVSLYFSYWSASTTFGDQVVSKDSISVKALLQLLVRDKVGGNGQSRARPVGFDKSRELNDSDQGWFERAGEVKPIS